MEHVGEIGKKAFAPLTQQEEVFVAEYLIHFNAAKAARVAGYSGKPAGGAFQWLRPHGPKPNVARAIRSAMRARLNRLEITADRVIAELGKLGFSNMMNYVRLDEEGLPLFDLSELNEVTGAAIKSITVDEYKEGRGEGAREIKRIKLELHDKRGALVDLAKHLGIMGPITGINNPGDSDDFSPQGGANTTIQNFNITLVPAGARFEGEKLIEGDIVEHQSKG